MSRPRARTTRSTSTITPKSGRLAGYLLAMLSLVACDAKWTTPRCPTATLTRDRVAAGWHALFDGWSIEAWRELSAGWAFADRELRSDGDAAELVTHRGYRHVELEVEWRAETRARASFAAGSEQIAAIQGTEPGEWNRIQIQKSLAARRPLRLVPGEGRITFRRILARELPPPTERRGRRVVLFDGDGLDHWQPHLRTGEIDGRRTTPADVWSVRDRLLVCRGEPWGYLYTKQKFESFVLRVSYRFDPVGKQAGNSGVLLRMTGEHRVWPRCIEAQVKSGYAGDFWNIGEFPMTVVHARTYGRNTRKSHGAEKPVGEWNDYEIIVDGPFVQLRLNGDVVNEAWDCEVIPGHICIQSEGAQIHFRHIEVFGLSP